MRGYELSSYKMKWLAKADRMAMSRDGKVVTLTRGSTVTHVDAATGRPVRAPPSSRGPGLDSVLARIPGLDRAKIVAALLGPRTVAVANHRRGQIVVFRVTP